MRVALDARHAGRGLGIANFLSCLARELVALGDVELIWLGDPKLAPETGARSVPVGHLPYPMLDGPLGRALARRLRPDVIHFTGNTGWGRPGPVPSVLTIQDLIFMAAAGRGRSARQVVGHAYEHWLIPRAARAADILAVSSETIAGQVRTQLGGELTPRVVPYGVATPPATARGPHAAPYLLAFAGRDPRKRTADVVAAWRALAAGGTDAPPLALELRLLAAAGLPPSLRKSLGPDIARGSVVILEHVPRERVWSELAGATALAYPSTDEGFGLPVLEGMAAGTPVLSGLAPATREVGGEAIVKLDPRDISGSIAAAVRRVHADPRHARAIADRGRARAATFTWRRTAEGYRDLYREAIAGRDQARPGRTVRH